MGVLLGPFPESPLARRSRSFPAKRRHTSAPGERHTPTLGWHPVLTTGDCGFRRAPTPPHGKRTPRNHNIGTPADDEEAAPAFFPRDEGDDGDPADFFSAVISTP